MNRTTLPSKFFSLVALAALLLSACTVTSEPPLPTSTPEPPVVIDPTPAPTQTSAPQPTPPAEVETGAPAVTFDLGSVTSRFTTEIVPAVPLNPENSWWVTLPEYTLVTLQDYPASQNLRAAQIFVFPAAELFVNDAAQLALTDLQALLTSQQVGETLPYLPLYNEAQVFTAQVEFMDFTTGRGVRYLTMYGQGIAPVNNASLLYTYQGLTSDGKYYVAVVLPVTLPGLPADGSLGGDLPANFIEDYNQYKVDILDVLNQSPAGDYVPSLADLDALVQSLEVK